MKQNYVNYLNQKGILVSNKGENQKEVLVSAVSTFGIVISEGAELASLDVIKQIESVIPRNIPESFYRGFPKSVLQLSVSELLLDQLFHYYASYCANVDSKYSLFEAEVERTLLPKSEVEYKQFRIVTEAEAEKLLVQYANDLLSGTRPLSDAHREFIFSMIQDGFEPVKIASLKTATEILYKTKDVKFAKFIHLQDVIKYVEFMLENDYKPNPYTKPMSIKKLNLKNTDRKFIAGILDIILENINFTDIKLCSEKKKIWCGLLHHIHYVAHTDMGKEFVNYMRGNKNISYLSKFEQLMSDRDVIRAAEFLTSHKGSGFALRNLNYIISRCENDNERVAVLNTVTNGNKNPIVPLQLAISYIDYDTDRKQRYFSFVKNGMITNHTETAAEVKARKSLLTKEVVDNLYTSTLANVKNIYSQDKFGKIYIDEKMKNIAMPLFESSANLGYGVLPTSSRVAIPDNVRVFTYWEKVNDIDLAVIGLNKDLHTTGAFGWYSMYGSQSDAITFSGDETRGYNGGSEYFDINIDAFKQKYPLLRYLLFTNNVYSGLHFNQVLCRAGYMNRKDLMAGQKYEPSTVKTSYAIDCDSTFALLFAIDLETKEMIWINKNINSNARVSFGEDYGYINKYVNAKDILNVYDFFSLKATEIVDKPEDADVIVSDEIQSIDDKVIVRSNDFEKLISLLNNNPLVDETKSE